MNLINHAAKPTILRTHPSGRRKMAVVINDYELTKVVLEGWGPCDHGSWNLIINTGWHSCNPAKRVEHRYRTMLTVARDELIEKYSTLFFDTYEHPTADEVLGFEEEKPSDSLPSPSGIS